MKKRKWPKKQKKRPDRTTANGFIRDGKEVVVTMVRRRGVQNLHETEQRGVGA